MTVAWCVLVEMCSSSALDWGSSRGDEPSSNTVKRPPERRVAWCCQKNWAWGPILKLECLPPRVHMILPDFLLIS